MLKHVVGMLRLSCHRLVHPGSWFVKTFLVLTEWRKWGFEKYNNHTHKQINCMVYPLVRSNDVKLKLALSLGPVSVLV